MKLTQPKMIFREAKVDDIKQIQIVRHSKIENTLSNPDMVTVKNNEEFLSVKGQRLDLRN